MFFWHFHMQYTLKIVTRSFSYLLPTPITSHPSNISPTFIVFFVLFCDLLCLTKHVCITWGLLVFISAQELPRESATKDNVLLCLSTFPYSQYPEQSCVPAFAAFHCKQKLLWSGLRVAFAYGHKQIFSSLVPYQLS